MLDNPITTIPGIGPKLEKAYGYLGIETVEDLLMAFPLRYEDFRATSGIGDVKPGETTTIQGTVTSVRARRSPRKRMMLSEATIEDASGTLTAVWFHQAYIAKQLKVGDVISLSGKIDDTYGLSMVNPQYEKVGASTVHTGRLVPVYSTAGKMAQKGRRNVLRQALKWAHQLEEWLPEDIIDRYDLLPINKAVPVLHFPEDDQLWGKAIRRLKFGELFLHQLAHAQSKQQLDQLTATAIPFDEESVKAFVESLPFTLTDAQRKASFQIIKDMEATRPMRRLLEGDVGAGKTVVAGIAIVNVAEAGFQTAYLAPTEILAVQQSESFVSMLGRRVTVALLTQGHQRINGEAVTRKEVLDGLLDGRIDLVVGTQALLIDDVKIPSLGLVIADEQHRFGVKQRSRLLQGEIVPHFLSMTATPIPRTLAMALYGDLAISILDELPAGRGDIETILLRPDQDHQTYQLMAQEIAKGTQAYVVCPFIEESDIGDQKSVAEIVEELKKSALSHLTIEPLHGKMKPKDKDAVMKRFAEGDIDVLVSTTVIEVGVNVPNATLMFIEGADRFGLAQLHQLRGRIRRSNKKATCFLRPTVLSGKTQERMRAMVQYDNGFALAEIDLKLRGAGDRFGTRQSGLPEFQYADLSDHVLIAQAREAAETMLGMDPALELHTAVKEQLSKKLAGIEG